VRNIFYFSIITCVSLVFALASFTEQPQASSANDLIACIKKNDEPGLKKLLETGVDPNGLDDNGITPLIYCVYRNDIQMAVTILNAKADINGKDSLGMTALHAAAFAGNTDLVKLLLENGADPDVKDLKGRAPSDYAMSADYGEIVSMLAKHRKNQIPIVITNEYLDSLRNSEKRMTNSFSASLPPSGNFPYADSSSGPKENNRSNENGFQDGTQQSDDKLLLGVVTAGNILNIDCQEGVPKVLIFKSDDDSEAEAYVSSQKGIQSIQRNKTTVNAIIPGNDGMTPIRSDVNLLSQTFDAPADYQWHVWLDSMHRERRDTVPCLKSGTAVLGIKGTIVVFTER